MSSELNNISMFSWNENYLKLSSKLLSYIAAFAELASSAAIRIWHSFQVRTRLNAVASVQMGSIADNGSGKSYAYRASKAALNQITKSLSIDLEPAGVSVVLLHPGTLQTF